MPACTHRAQAEQARAEQAKEEEDEPDWLRAASGQGASTSSAQPEQSRAAQARARRSKKPAVPRHGVQDLLGWVLLAQASPLGHGLEAVSHKAVAWRGSLQLLNGVPVSCPPK